MNIDNEIRAYMAATGTNASQVARDIGTTAQNLNRKLTSQSLKYKEAHEIAAKLGYKIVWQKTERPPE